MEATDAYRRSQEPLADFVADRCRLGADCSITAERLRAEYEDWCRSTGVKDPVRGKAWGAGLRALGRTDGRPGGVRGWHGVQLLQEHVPGGAGSPPREVEPAGSDTDRP
jgi:hypothetical protein